MRKFYLMLLACLFCAISASASDFYLVGDSYGWSKNSYKFTPTGNANEYTLKVESFSGNFKILEDYGNGVNYCGYAKDKDWPTVDYGTFLYVRGGGYSPDTGDNGVIKVNGKLENVTLTLTTGLNGNLWSLKVSERQQQQTVATPVISQDGNSVTITCGTDGATIYYTLNGSTPSTSSTRYNGAFDITADCTVKAIATKTDWLNSAVATQNVTYTAPVIPGDNIVYFLNDDSSWVTPHCYFYGNNVTAPDPFTSAPEMTKVGEYTDASGKKYSVWSYTFEPGVVPANVIFHNGYSTGTNQTNDFEYKNGGVYKYNEATDLTPEQILGGELSDVTFYFHAKNDYRSDGNLTKLPIARLITDDADQSLTFQNGTEMVCVDKSIELYAVTFTGAQVAAAHDIIFGFLKNGTQEIQAYRAGYAPDGKYQWDKDNWTKYIYATRTYDFKNYACQAWLTYEDYVAMAAQNRDNLYFVGDFNGKGWDLRNNLYTEACEPDEPGLFYFDITNANPSNKKFKVSWMVPNPEGKVYGSFNAETVNHRDWCTYDLGILGVNQDDERIAGKNVINTVTEQGSEVRDVEMYQSQSLPYNHLNQFNWLVKDYDNAKYVIIDMHPDCQTLTVVTFEPNPQVTGVEMGTPEVYELTDNQLNQLHTTNFIASEHNGAVKTRQVNTVSGTVNVKGSAVSDFADKFTVAFQPWMNGAYLGEHEVVGDRFPTGLKMPYLAPDGDRSDVLGLRSKYTSKVTGLSFHSHLSKAQYTNNIDLAGPTISDKEGTYVNFGAECWGIGATVEVQYPNDNILAMYADYELESGDRHDHTFLVDKNHWMAQMDNVKDVFNVHGTWERWNGEDEYNDNTHNWAKHFTTHGSFPIYIHNVADIVRTGNNKFEAPEPQDLAYKFNAIAAYPFLVNPNATLEPIFSEVVNPEPEPDPVYPEQDFYFVGDTKENSWKLENAYRFARQADGTYYLEVDMNGKAFKMSSKADSWDNFNSNYIGIEGQYDRPVGTFALGTQYAPTNKDWNLSFANTGKWYLTINAAGDQITLSNTPKASAPARIIGMAKPLQVTDLSQFEVVSANVKTAFRVYVNANSGTTGVDNIVADDSENAEAVLYNLQGVRVQGTPAPGIYLSRKGNVTTKVVIR